jgi:hypothetical protein
MKRFAIMLAVGCLGSSLVFAGTQAGPSSPTTNETAIVENNSAKPEKRNSSDSGPTKKTKKHAHQNTKRTDTSGPLTAEELEWERTVYNP